LGIKNEYLLSGRPWRQHSTAQDSIHRQRVESSYKTCLTGFGAINK